MYSIESADRYKTKLIAGRHCTRYSYNYSCRSRTCELNYYILIDIIQRTWDIYLFIYLYVSNIINITFQVTVELIKVIKGVPLEEIKNCFLNLGLPVFLFSEPGAVEKTKMRWVSWLSCDLLSKLCHKHSTLIPFRNNYIHLYFIQQWS